MKLLDYLEVFFSTYGYLSVFSVLILCGLGLPIPEDITLIAGGIISGLGQADLLTMIFIGIAGVLIGDGLMFTLGKALGPRVLNSRWIAKIMTSKNYESIIQQKFDKYGNGVIFVARFLPVLRTPIYITAGMSGKISYIKFILMDGFATLISVPIWICLGHYGAEKKELLLGMISNFKIIIFILLGILFIIIAIRWRKKHQKKISRSRQ
ncbi:MAG: DedA family protein [Neisseriaceae bacterium]|nr:MAG: DedA family protein [Neisseriaceae bacterium]